MMVNLPVNEMYTNKYKYKKHIHFYLQFFEPIHNSLKFLLSTSAHNMRNTRNRRDFGFQI